MPLRSVSACSEYSAPWPRKLWQGGVFLEGSYDIYLGDRSVGKAEVVREGLYYRFRCRCQRDGDSVCRVYMGEINLGVLIPDEEGYCLDAKIPVSRFKEAIPSFTLQPNKAVLQGRFVSIKPEEPFGYIARLKEAHLSWHNGQIGIVIQEKAGT